MNFSIFNKNGVLNGLLTFVNGRQCPFLNGFAEQRKETDLYSKTVQNFIAFSTLLDVDQRLALKFPLNGCWDSITF